MKTTKQFLGVILASTLAFSAAPVLAAPSLDDPLVAQGKVLFETDAGDMGCAICHGMEAEGSSEMGGVFIQGARMAQIQNAVNGAVPVMTFFDLSADELQAIEAYLDYLWEVNG